MSMVDQEEEVDEDEENLFKKISETYLRNKFEACDRPELTPSTSTRARRPTSWSATT